MFALAGWLVPAGAHAAVDPGSACDLGVSAAYIQWATSTTGAATTAATAPAFDTGFPGVATPGAYFAQGKMLIKTRTSDGVKQWSWCPPNITNCTNIQGSVTIGNSPAVVPLSTPGLHGCGAGPPCVFAFVGGSDGFLYKVDTPLGGVSVLSADTRRKLNATVACQTAPGDSIEATPAVVLYAFADATPGSRGKAFRDDIDATAGHAGDDLVIVVTSNGCGDTTRNRVIAYWAKDLTTKWIFNADGEVKVDRSMGGCTIDYPAMRLYCGTDLADEAAGQSSLFALDIITGALLWSDNAGAILNRPMLNSSANVLYVASKAGAVMAYDPAGDLGRAAPRWPTPLAVAPPGKLINKPLWVESGTGTWWNRILAMDSGGALHAVADCDLPNPPAGCAADGMLLWSKSALGTGVSFKSRPIVLPGAAMSRAFIGRSDGYMQMLELSDTDLSYKGVVTASPSAPNSAEVFEPAFDEGGTKIVVVSGTRISKMQRDPALLGTGDPNELFCTVVPFGNAGCTSGGMGGNSCNRPQFDQYNPCLIYTCNTTGGSFCQKVSNVKPTGMVPDGTPCSDEWTGAPVGAKGQCTSSTLRNTDVTDANCASATCPGCLPGTNPPYFLGKGCTTNTECFPCRSAAGTPVNTTNVMCRCPDPLDLPPCNIAGTGKCVCNSASQATTVTLDQALALCNDACVAGTCAKNVYTAVPCINSGDLGCSAGNSCCGSLNGGCVNLLTDPKHCGDCSNNCNTYHSTGVVCTMDSQCTEYPNGNCGFAVTATSCATNTDCTNALGPGHLCSGSPDGVCHKGTCRYLTQAGTCVDGACVDWPACPSPGVSDLASAGIKGVDALAFSRAATCDAFVTTYRTTAPVADAPCGPACASDAACGGGDCTNGFCCPAGKSCVGGTCKVANVQKIASGGALGYFTINADVSRMHGVGVLRSGTTAFGSFVNDPLSAGTAGLGLASGTTATHPLASSATVGASNEPFAATEFDRGPVGPAVDTAVSTDSNWTVYFGNFVGGGCNDMHLCKITGGVSPNPPVAVTWFNQPCVEPLPGDGICQPIADLTPERITALAFGQREFSPPAVYHRYLIVAHGTTLSFLDLEGGASQKDIDLTNRNIYDPTTPAAVARGESTPVAVLGIAAVPYGDLVVEVRGSNGIRFLLNVDAHDQSVRHQRAVQRDIQEVHPCAAGGVCPASSTCVQGVCLQSCGTGTCPDGTTCTLIGGGSCESPGGNGNPVCCIDNAVADNFGFTDGRLSVMPDGKLLRFVPSAIGAPATDWRAYQLTPAGYCTGTLAAVNNSVVGSHAGGTDTQVSWTDSPGLFNVYRGSRSGAAWSYNHTCFAPLAPGSAIDSGVPPSGTAFYYLVSRETGCGESSLGAGRPNPSPCP